MFPFKLISPAVYEILLKTHIYNQASLKSTAVYWSTGFRDIIIRLKVRACLPMCV